jgi:hypothetical protein
MKRSAAALAMPGLARLRREPNKRHAPFLRYAGGVHARRAALLVGVAVIAYALHDPFDGPNGGTWLGYVLGTIGALLIVWLTLLGLRKRSYRSGRGTMEGWLSAHVYYGIALLPIATLHSAAELQWNIHGAAYLLLVLVIATGLFGAYVYSRFPALIVSGRGGVTRAQLMEEISELDRRCRSVAQKVGADVFAAAQSAIDRTVLGGSPWSLVGGRDASTVELIGVAAGKPLPNSEQKTFIAYLAARLGKSRGAAETLSLQELLDLSAKRQSALRVVREDLRRQTLVSLWLDIHVPLTFALWGALVAHIVSVFVYW